MNLLVLMEMSVETGINLDSAGSFLLQVFNVTQVLVVVLSFVISKFRVLFCGQPSQPSIAIF